MQKLSLALSGSLLLALAGTTGCGSIYYATMEKFGYAKRDLLIERVEEARTSQTEAKEEIQDTFTAFKTLTGFDGGALEDKYEELNDKLEASTAAAEDVTERVDSVEKVATDLFAEWDEEIEQISNADIQAKSRRLRSDAESRYKDLMKAMRAAEARMAPVLSAFNDQVLFLKHNLNAQAVSSLQDEVMKIEDTVSSLIAEMERSIAEADEFISEMQPAS